MTDGGKTYTLASSIRASTSRPTRRSRARRAELDRGGLRVLDQALSRSHEPVALRFPVRGKIERPRRARALRRKDRAIRLRRAGGGARNARPLHAAGTSEGDAICNFAHVIAFPLTGAVAREAIEAYGDDTNSHPVGTGPYLLKKYVRSSKITLEANPGYRGRTWDFKPGDDPRDKEIVAHMKGKKLPRIGTRRDQRHGGDAEPLARLRARRDRHRVPAVGHRAHLHDRRRQAQARVRETRDQARPQRRSRRSSTSFFNMQEKIGGKPNPVGGFAQGEDRAAPRDRHGVQRSTTRSSIIRKGQAIKRRSFRSRPASRATTRTTRAASSTTRGRPTRCWTSSATRRAATATARMPDGKPLRHPLLLVPDRARPPVRRADEALARLDRDPRRNPQGSLARADQGCRSCAGS